MVLSCGGAAGRKSTVSTFQSIQPQLRTSATAQIRDAMYKTHCGSDLCAAFRPSKSTICWTALGTLLVLVFTAVPARAQTDAIDLYQATVYNSPSDIASWPVTASITQLTMAAPDFGLSFEF